VVITFILKPAEPELEAYQGLEGFLTTQDDVVHAWLEIFATFMFPREQEVGVFVEQIVVVELFEMFLSQEKNHNAEDNNNCGRKLILEEVVCMNI